MDAGVHGRNSESATLRIPAIRGGATWELQKSVHIPVVYYGEPRKITDFHLRLAVDTSRLLIKMIQTHVFRKNGDSVFLDYHLSPLSVTKLREFNSTIHIRSEPNSEYSTNEIQLNDSDTLVMLTVSKKVLRELSPRVVPISWIWIECDDNQLITPEIHSLSMSVIDYQYNDCIYDLREPDIADSTQSLPTARGAPAECTAPLSPDFTLVRDLEFKNGGIRPYIPDVRIVGDANNSFVPFEIGDALELARFITHGLRGEMNDYRVIGDANMNCDKYPADISDFALILRAATGDIMHEFYISDSIAPDTVTFSQEREILSIDRPVIAALLILDNEFPVEMIGDGLRSDTGAIDGNTHVLIYNLGEDNDSLLNVPPGLLLKTWGVLIDAYAVNYDGYKMHTLISQ